MTNPFDSAGSKAPPKPFTVSEGRREVRSFVLRQGRFTPAQQRAFDERWPRFGLDYTGQPRDLDATFGRPAHKVLESASATVPRCASPPSTTRHAITSASKCTPRAWAGC